MFNLTAGSASCVYVLPQSKLCKLCVCFTSQQALQVVCMFYLRASSASCVYVLPQSRLCKLWVCSTTEQALQVVSMFYLRAGSASCMYVFQCVQFHPNRSCVYVLPQSRLCKLCVCFTSEQALQVACMCFSVYSSTPTVTTWLQGLVIALSGCGMSSMAAVCASWRGTRYGFCSCLFDSAARAVCLLSDMRKIYHNYVCFFFFLLFFLSGSGMLCVTWSGPVMSLFTLSPVTAL